MLALGCASPPKPAQTPVTVPVPAPAFTPKSDIWPKIYDDETYLSAFASTWSVDEAIGAVKNLQNSMVEFNAGLAFSELSVDPYGLRARWTWTENGSIVKSSGVIVPFDQVASLLLEYYPKLDKEYRWGLIVSLTDKSSVSIRTPTREAAERLGKAILALAVSRGSKPSMPNPRFGAALAPLSEVQAQAAGILASGGIIVSWIFKESPAEKAGFSAQDIITGVGGIAVRKSDDLFAAIDAAAAAGAKGVKISGLRRTYRVEGSKYIEVFVPLTFNLAIDPTGASK
jgi:hypothetical protein